MIKNSTRKSKKRNSIHKIKKSHKNNKYPLTVFNSRTRLKNSAQYRKFLRSIHPKSIAIKTAINQLKDI